jgi:hypothetical protein
LVFTYVNAIAWKSNSTAALPGTTIAVCEWITMRMMSIVLIALEYWSLLYYTIIHRFNLIRWLWTITYYIYHHITSPLSL